jgi:hypothetical protein
MNPRRLLLAVAAALSLAAAPVGARTIEDGVLDLIELHVETIPAGVPVVLRPFDASEAELGSGDDADKPKRMEIVDEMQRRAPGIMAGAFVEELADRGTFAEVTAETEGSPPPDALVVSGAFTVIDPGSRAKRYFVGFGSGKGALEIAGEVRDGAGSLLATFRQRRLTVIGIGGGSYVRKIEADSERLGEDVAEFLDLWARGRDLD